ncbi:MAG: efflux RND transporter permease subunit, partial [Sinobacterium sp.]|nr:efflux RND transporter permease subunit [Sinobacterium sp.]
QALFLDVKVTGHPDVLKTNQEVMHYLDVKRQTLPESLKLTVWHDFSVSFKDRIHTLVTNGASGLLLVFIVLMLFLRPLLALWVCIGIFVAFLGTLWVMPILGASLNMISLFAFLMILGIVVDDAIIVGESVYSEQQRHGAGIETAIRGTQRVYKPVLFAVASTMLVFVPMLFLPGQSAKSSQAIPTVVLLTLFFSLIESLFILPSHLAHMPKEGHFDNAFIKKFDQFRAVFSNNLERFTQNIYQPILKMGLAHYGSSIAAFLVMMVVSLSIFTGGWISFSFLPNVTTDYIILQVTLPQGEPESLTESLTKRIEAASKQVQAGALFSDSDTSHVSHYSIRGWNNHIYAAMGLNREYTSTIGSPELIERWKKAIGPIPEAENTIYYYQISSQGKPLQYRISSNNNDSLNSVSQELQTYLADFAGVYDVKDSQQTPRSEIELSLKKSSEFAAWNMSQLSQQVRSAFYGSEVKRIARDGEDIRIMVKLAEHERGQFESIRQLPVMDSDGNIVDLDAVSDIKYVPALQDITRVDKKRSITISADLKDDTSDAIAISSAVMGEFFDSIGSRYPDVTLSLVGQEEER